MSRLMAGSRGTLGVITQVTLMVRPLAETSALVACDLPEMNLAERLLAGLIGSSVRPVAVELFAGRCGQGNPVLGPMLDGSLARLYIGFEGSTPEVEWMVGQLRADWSAAGVVTPVLVAAPAAEQHWRWLAEFAPDARINVLPGELVETIVKLVETEPDCAIRAHAGDGVIRIGNVDGKRLSAARGYGPEIRVMQAIKDRFDPQNILNPGRFVFA
jgi:glycolate oxidase FAD binding subunit